MKQLLKPSKLHCHNGESWMVDRELHESSSLCIMKITNVYDCNDTRTQVFSNNHRIIDSFKCGIMTMKQAKEGMVHTMHHFYGLNHRKAVSCTEKVMKAVIKRMASELSQ